MDKKITFHWKWDSCPKPVAEIPHFRETWISPSLTLENKHWANVFLVTILWIQSNPLKCKCWLLVLIAAEHSRAQQSMYIPLLQVQRTTVDCKSVQKMLLIRLFYFFFFNEAKQFQFIHHHLKWLLIRVILAFIYQYVLYR